MTREQTVDSLQRVWRVSCADVLASTGWNSFRETVHAGACFVAISLAFLVYGVLQERMMTVGFGPDQELFTWSLFLVFSNRLLTCTSALCILSINRGAIWPVAPLQSYGAVSFGNLVASTCQYDSLKYVSFALQTLAKCCKMLPVMFWGFFIGGHMYSASELVTAAAVMGGCGAFIFSGDVLSGAVDDPHSVKYYAIGVFLLLTYLAFDGFVSTWQDQLFAGYDMDTSNQVLYTTLCSCVLSAAILVFSKDMTEALEFLKRHPEAWVYILAVSSVAAIIQYFVSYTIKAYGALNFATLMTARQFLSIIASCVVFDHSFTVGQWIGTVVVFSALTARIVEKRQAKAQSRQPKSSTPSRSEAHEAVAGHMGPSQHTGASHTGQTGESELLHLLHTDTQLSANGYDRVAVVRATAG